MSVAFSLGDGYRAPRDKAENKMPADGLVCRSDSGHRAAFSVGNRTLFPQKRSPDGLIRELDGSPQFDSDPATALS